MIEKHSGMKIKHSYKSGFTLVELSLSLVFIAILSITVVLVMTSAISSYHRAITLGKVENVGSGLVRDIQSSIRSASAKSLKLLCGDNYADTEAAKICQDDGGKNFAMVMRRADVTTNKTTGAKSSLPVFGALCTGMYSYIWNSGYFFNENDYAVQEGVEMASLRYRVGNGAERVATGFKLLKIKDESRKVCEAAIRVDKTSGEIKNNYYVKGINADGVDIQSEINMAKLVNTDEEPIEYLGNRSTNSDEETVQTSEDNGDNNLAIYSMDTYISEHTKKKKNAYYYNSFILGTVQGGINIGVSGDFCAVSEGSDGAVENMDYCSINKFNFAALATGG